ncbi:hypothetical protein J1614_011627 [Plenodomus biglobosus]|nr:hypothetical protein J1614_011627 [Plenodomus biglobosus]
MDGTGIICHLNIFNHHTFHPTKTTTTTNHHHEPHPHLTAAAATTAPVPLQRASAPTATATSALANKFFQHSAAEPYLQQQKYTNEFETGPAVNGPRGVRGGQVAEEIPRMNA